MTSIIKLLTVLLSMLTLASNGFPHVAEFTEEFKRDFPGYDCIIIPAQDVTGAVLEARKDWDEYLVYVTTGTVQNDAQDGREDLPEPYNYISYRGVPFETEPGMRIVTYFVYELHSDGEDDTIIRYDYPLTFPGQPLN